MKKKSILIFGAGLNQYQLIKAAKNLGITSIVLDPDPNAPGKELADFFYCVSGNDYKTTKDIALKHRVDSLATTQMENPLRLMARLAHDLSLPFHSPEVIEKSLDKWLMKQTFLKNDIPCATGILLEREEIIKISDLEKLQYPLILKPKDATSSRGVFKVNNHSETEKYLPVSRSFSTNGSVIIEEFLSGKEYSIETITYRAKTTVIQYTEKFITPFPHTVEMGHLQPAELTQNEREEIKKVVVDAIKVIGIDNSAAHTEIKITPDGPKILEIGARGGGDFISSWLTMASTGISMDEAIIQTSLDIKPDLKQKYKTYSFIKYFSLPLGKKIIKVEDYSDILKKENVVFAHIAVKEGDIVEEITESKKRPGFIIVNGDNKKKIMEIADNYNELLKLKIKLK